MRQGILLQDPLESGDYVCLPGIGLGAEAQGVEGKEGEMRLGGELGPAMKGKVMRCLGVAILTFVLTLACQISPKLLCSFGIQFFPTETIAVAEEYLQEQSDRIANNTGYRFTFEETDLDVCSGIVSTRITIDQSERQPGDATFLHAAIWLAAMDALYRATVEADPNSLDPIHSIVINFSTEPRYVWGRVRVSMKDMAALEEGEITLDDFLDRLRIDDHWDFEQLPALQ